MEFDDEVLSLGLNYLTKSGQNFKLYKGILYLTN